MFVFVSGEIYEKGKNIWHFIIFWELHSTLKYPFFVMKWNDFSIRKRIKMQLNVKFYGQEKGNKVVAVNFSWKIYFTKRKFFLLFWINLTKKYRYFECNDSFYATEDIHNTKQISFLTMTNSHEREFLTLEISSFN